jgi:hypothetical protein
MNRDFEKLVTPSIPSRLLACHFLELPFHEQAMIGQMFGVDWHDYHTASGFPNAVFKAAKDSKRIAELWQAVEHKHPHGYKVWNPYVECLTAS